MQVTIEKLVQGGSGFARLDSNKSIFVEGALPGEVVEVIIDEEKKGYAKARVKTILQPSADRTEPPCPYWGVCGGCDLQHLFSSKQPEAKQKMVLENLERIGGIASDSFVLGEPAFSKSWAYRSRVRFHVDINTREIGFLAKKSNTLVPITTCPILVDSLNVELAKKDKIPRVCSQTDVLLTKEEGTVHRGECFCWGQEGILRRRGGPDHCRFPPLLCVC